MQNTNQDNAMSPEDKITELAYISRGLAYVMLYALSEITPENDPRDQTHDLYTQALVLCEKLDELSNEIDHNF